MLLGFSVPAIAHNEANGGYEINTVPTKIPFGKDEATDGAETEEGEDIKNWNKLEEDAECVG